MESPRVFISYSHDSDEHKKWVENLAFLLRKDFGIDVILDIWDLKLGSVLPKFMETLTEADRVLMVCTENYCEKCDNDDRSGVAYEKLLMSSELMKSVYGNTLIQIVRENVNGRLPKFIGSRFYADFRDDTYFYDNLKKLAAEIYEVEYAKPALGRNPFIQGFDLNFGDDGICILPNKAFSSKRLFKRDDAILITGTVNAVPNLIKINSTGEIDNTFGQNGLLCLKEPDISYGMSGEHFFVNDIFVRNEDILVIPRFDLGQHNQKPARFNYDGEFIGFENFGVENIGAVIYNEYAPLACNLHEGSVVVVLNQDGYLDTSDKDSFCTNMKDIQNLRTSWFRFYISNNQIYVFGKRGDQHRQSFIARFDSTGNIDTTFGQEGIVNLNRISEADRHPFHNQVLTVTLQEDNRILVGGAANEADIARLLHDGSPDNSFGEKSLVDFRANFRGVCERLFVIEKSIIVVGTESDGKGGQSIFIGRLDLDGSMDTSFYGDGYFTIQVKGKTEYRDIFIADNKITILCQTDTDSQTHNKAALARIHI